MPDYEPQWDTSGAFPSSKKTRPIITKNDDNSQDPIFSDEDFDGAFDTLATVNEASVASSETPAISNTTTDVVRNAVYKNKIGNDGRIEKIYPLNMFRGKDEKGEGQEKKGKSLQVKGKGLSNNSNGKGHKVESKRGKADDQPNNKSDPRSPSKARSPPVRIAPVLSTVQDEPLSVMTDDPQQEHNEYIYDYMAEGPEVEPPMSVASVRSRRHGGGSKHHMVRHTLPTSQKVTANPTNMLKNLFISIEEERHLHRLTAQHQRAINNWLLFCPSILFSLLAGLIVLIFEANIAFSDAARIYSSVAVGILALVSVVWQALSKQMDLGTRSALHDACSVALKRLSEDILLTISATETIPAEYVALIGEKYGQAADACPLTIPYKLEAAFSHLSDRMVLMLQPQAGQSSHKMIAKKIDVLQLYSTAYDELAAEVINCFAFPFIIPDPRRVSKTALKNFKSIITEGKEIRRNRYCKSMLCPCLVKPDEERGLFDVLSSVAVAGPSMSQSQHSI